MISGRGIAPTRCRATTDVVACLNDKKDKSMKLRTIVLATAFALSSTFALAQAGLSGSGSSVGSSVGQSVGSKSPRTFNNPSPSGPTPRVGNPSGNTLAPNASPSGSTLTPTGPGSGLRAPQVKLVSSADLNACAALGQVTA